MFTDLGKVQVGDTFLKSLVRSPTYRVSTRRGQSTRRDRSPAFRTWARLAIRDLHAPGYQHHRILITGERAHPTLPTSTLRARPDIPVSWWAAASWRESH